MEHYFLLFYMNRPLSIFQSSLFLGENKADFRRECHFVVSVVNNAMFMRCCCYRESISNKSKIAKLS